MVETNLKKSGHDNSIQHKNEIVVSTPWDHYKYSNSYYHYIKLHIFWIEMFIFLIMFICIYFDILTIEKRFIISFAIFIVLIPFTLWAIIAAFKWDVTSFFLYITIWNSLYLIVPLIMTGLIYMIYSRDWIDSFSLMMSICHIILTGTILIICIYIFLSDVKKNRYVLISVLKIKNATCWHMIPYFLQIFQEQANRRGYQNFKVNKRHFHYEIKIHKKNLTMIIKIFWQEWDKKMRLELHIPSRIDDEYIDDVKEIVHEFIKRYHPEKVITYGPEMVRVFIK